MLLLVLSLAPRGLSPGSPVFPKLLKSQIPIPIWNSRVRLNVVLKKRFVGKLITTTFFFKQNSKSVDPNSQLRSQSYFLPVLTERERETGRRENLATRLPNSRLERRKVFASHSFLFKQIANMTGRFPKTLQMRIRKNAV